MFHHDLGLISREIYSIGMSDVVVSILKFLKLAEDGFHKLSKGYGIYVVIQYLNVYLICGITYLN